MNKLVRQRVLGVLVAVGISSTGWAALSDEVSSIEIYAGRDFDSDEYLTEVYAECESSVTGVSGTAPFGAFTCEQDGDFWEFEDTIPASGSQPSVNGDWTFTFAFAGGSTTSTVISFTQADGVTPIPDIPTCPEISSPDLSSGSLSETNALVTWDTSFDPAANLAGLGYYDTNLTDDVEIEFEGTDLQLQQYGPVDFVPGFETIWLFNGYLVEGVNGDGIPFEIARFAVRDHYITVLPAPNPSDPLTNHVSSIEIYAGVGLVSDEYELEVNIECDETVTGIIGVAPFGPFVCEFDYDEWEFEAEIPTSGGMPPISGDWTFTFTFENGSVDSTVIPFKKLDGSDLPLITDCPQITTPDISVDYMLETNVVISWSSPFNLSANWAAIGYWNAADDEDVDIEFEGADLLLTQYGPVDLEAGIEEMWIFNAFTVEGINSAGLPYMLATFASYDYDVVVTRGDWDVDADHLSNEWELSHFGTMTNGVASEDGDGDGADNLAEFYAGTDPDAKPSVYDMSVTMNKTIPGVDLSWPAPLAGRFCSVLGGSNLISGMVPLATNLSTQTTYSDTRFGNGAAGFYEVRVRPAYDHISFAPLSDITVDGLTADWGSQVPQLADPVGDAGLYSGLDVTGVFFARSGSELFLRIDRAGLDMPDAGEYSSVWIFLHAIGGEGNNYGINISGSNSDLTYNYIQQMDENYTTSVEIANNVPMNADGQSIELSIPLSSLDLVGQYRIEPFTHYTELGEFNESGENQGNAGILSMP